jgi:outer membrane protein assembly factor BamA
VDTFSNFDIVYADLSNRLQWQVHLFDDRNFYLQRDLESLNPFDTERSRERYQVTGIIGSLIYPLSFYTRGEIGVGYAYRQFTFPDLDISQDPDTGEPVVRTVFNEFEQDFPVLTGSLVNDSTIFGSSGPVSGGRWRLDLNYSPDFDEGGTLSSSVDLDVRRYISLTRRSQIALRLFGAISEGNNPALTYFGGLDTVRGYRFRSLVGDRGFFANVELRFPLIDVLATPILGFQGIRGVVFLDVGGAWFDEFEDFDLWDSENSQLADAVASYGYGITVRFGFLDLNWDFAKRTNLKDSDGEGYRSSFWIGTRF